MSNKVSPLHLELMQARIKFIPEQWLFSTVGESFDICNNLRKPISESERNENIGKYPYYGPTKIQGYISSFEQDGKYVLIGEDGDHFLKYKELSMTHLIEGKCTVNNHAHIIKGRENATREWFYYYFMHRDIFSFLSRQGAGRYKLNKSALNKLPILIPPLPEQQKIAKILSTWDQAINKTEELLANSQQQKKALMQKLLTGKERLINPETGERFTGAWEAVKVADFGQIVTGNTPSKNDPRNYGVEFSWATAEDFNRKYVKNTKIKLSQLGKAKARLVPKGSVLITCIASIGKNAISGEELATNQQINSIVVNDTHHNEFIYYLITFNTHKLLAYAGTTAVPIINKSSFESVCFTVPPLNEQQKIADVLTNADKEIETLSEKLTHLKQEKKALMQQLLTGKIRVVV